MTKKVPHVAWKSFLYFMLQNKLKLSIAVFTFLVSNAFLALVPIFIGKLTGALAANPVQRDDAIIFTIVLILLSSGHDLTWRLSEYVFYKLVLPLSYLYENILFEKIVSQPYPYFVDKFTGKVSHYIATISDELREFLENLCFSYTNQIVSFVALALIMSSINWQTGLIFIVGMVGMIIAGRPTMRYSASKEKLAADVKSTKNAKIVDIIANFVNVKSFKKEVTEIKVIQNEQDKTIEGAKKSHVASVIFWATMSFFVRHFIWPITIALNVYLFLEGQLSIEKLATLLSAILLFSTTIWDTVWLFSQLNLKLARADEAHSYLFGKVLLQDVKTQNNTPSPAAFSNEFSIDHMDFAYPDKPDRKILRDICLTIKKGEKVGIVGKSGSGKTTLTKILLDYYDVPAEMLKVDGEPVHPTRIAQLISYVPQDTSLFHRTIADNIAYAADSAVTKEQIVQAAKRAHAHEFIAQVENDYDALVGERGIKLSAGQRQRIAIARAFLDDKPILILDEATSALDSESEILIQEALEALWSNKTVIAIAHRLSTLRQMDRIIVMDDGKIIEEGSHKALIEQRGAYAKLWDHQSGGFIEE